MPNVSSDAKALLQDIQAEYPDVSLPHDDDLLSPSSYSWDDVKPFAKPNWLNWWDVPANIIKDNYGILPFLSSAAYHFYLPAYMSVSLSDPTAFTVAEFTRYSLPPGSDDVISSYIQYFDYSDEKFSHFTESQLAVAKRFADHFDKYANTYGRIL